MRLDKEFRSKAGALVLAIVKGLTPVSSLTTPLNVSFAHAGQAIVQPVAHHITPSERMAALYYKNLQETARTNTMVDTYTALTFNGQAISGDRPRRRPLPSDKWILGEPS